jgi:hypothetical protein
VCVCARACVRVRCACARVCVWNIHCMFKKQGIGNKVEIMQDDDGNIAAIWV